MAKNNVKKFAIGAAIAGLAGYVAGILTAPKSGKETRQDVKKAAVKAKTEAEKRLKSLHSELNDLIGQAKQQATKLKKSAGKEFAVALEKAQKAKQKTREILSALHEGDADDKDLKTALSEAKKAASHLKTFLSKNNS